MLIFMLMHKNKEEYSVNKSELIAALAGKAELSKKDAEKVLGSFVDTVSESLAKGEKIQLIGFGTFEVRKHKARVGKNPRTGESVKIKASKSVAFKPGQTLKNGINKKKSIDTKIINSKS